ncbi:hypothetical protein DPV78_001727 [Talaromyces pinophilus]|nr:hypothetical protein DPV78_001727 [Talaromyces pinophilus]
MQQVYAIFLAPLLAIFALAGPAMEKSNQVTSYLDKRQLEMTELRNVRQGRCIEGHKAEIDMMIIGDMAEDTQLRTV